MDSQPNGKSKLTPIATESSLNIGLPFLDTETSEQWTGAQLNPSMSCAEDSPAKISALLENELGLTEPEADCGVNISEPLCHFDPAMSSWRTSQVSLLTLTWDVYLETWPRAGTMRNGIAFQHPQSVPSISEIGCGSWPTPRKSDGKGTNSPICAMKVLTRGFSPNLPEAVQLDRIQMWPTPRKLEIVNGLSHLQERSRPSGLTSMVNKVEGLPLQTTGKLNPQWVEWLMGYPAEWTALPDLATPSSLKSQKR